jgi:hypothetical protein
MLHSLFVHLHLILHYIVGEWCVNLNVRLPIHP